MTGTILNALAIVLGCGIALGSSRQMSGPTQVAGKVLLGAFTVWTGLSTTWLALNGTFLQCLSQLGLAVLALMLGNITGKLLRLQKHLNRLGGYARRQFEAAAKQPGHRFNEGFLACTILYTANPLGVFGAVLEGASGNWKILAVKAIMDGLSALAFARAFGTGAVLSVIPVVAFQGTLTLLMHGLAVDYATRVQLDALGAVGGLLVFSVSLILLDLKKVELADYLPTLLYAPLLAWLIRG